MIKDIEYTFEDFIVGYKENSLVLIPQSDKYDLKQMELFTTMLNFGYIDFKPGVFSLSAKDAVQFWNYAKDVVLKRYTIDEYYDVLNLEKPYGDKIPSISTAGSFHSNEFSMKVVWIKTDSKMFSAPIAYEQEGLKLKELDFGEVLGTLYPEYFELYYMIDEANSFWKDLSVKQRYDFLESLEKHSEKRKFILPKNLSELLSKHKGES